MRHQARTAAMQLVYQLDMQGVLAAEKPCLQTARKAVSVFWQTQAQTAQALTQTQREYTQRVVCGVAEHIGAVDAALRKAMRHWRPERVQRTELAIARVAVYEMLWVPDVPRAVVIDEAICLGQKFCGTQAGAFLNGVLDAIQPQSQSQSQPKS